MQAYEELLSLQRQVDTMKAAQEEAAENAELAAAEISGLKARLADISKELDQEKQARALAAAEAESRFVLTTTSYSDDSYRYVYLYNPCLPTDPKVDVVDEHCSCFNPHGNWSQSFCFLPAAV